MMSVGISVTSLESKAFMVFLSIRIILKRQKKDWLQGKTLILLSK